MQLFGVSRPTVYGWIRDNLVESFLFRRRAESKLAVRLIKRASVEAYFERCAAAAKAEKLNERMAAKVEVMKAAREKKAKARHYG